MTAAGDRWRAEIRKELNERLSSRFALQCRADDLEPEQEYIFHKLRKWRFDFAFLAERVAVEIEGGISSRAGTNVKSRHATGDGFTEDVRKYFEAMMLGWLVVRVTGEMVRTGEAMEMTKRALEMRRRSEA